MNILLLNTYDVQGGAAIATYRIQRGLSLIGVNSQLLVQSKKIIDPNVVGQVSRWGIIFSFLRIYLDKFLLRKYPRRQKVYFSPGKFSDNLSAKIEKINPDITHLFWINDGFLSIEEIKNLRKPIVWTLHDMWPFTGGCHYDVECRKFIDSCGNCPLLNSDNENDLSKIVWQRKKKSWKDLPIVVVATSKWLAEMAQSSSLFRNQRIEIIPNGIDTEKYKPLDKRAARAAYNLPQDKKLILFSAFNATSEIRKGGHLLAKALEMISQSSFKSEIELVIIGSMEFESTKIFNMNVHYMGYFNDEISQILLYSAADVVVAPSMQENLSNTVMESLSCGTPVVAFNIGGMPDMIDHQENGYLATPFDIADLANGLLWVLNDQERHQKLSKSSRQKVLDHFEQKMVAKLYLDLYENILELTKSTDIKIRQQ